MMCHIWMLATANLRKNKGQATSLFALILIVAMFLNIGLVMFFGMGQFFDERGEELNTAHFSTFLSAYGISDAQQQFIEQYPGVTDVEQQNIVGGHGDFFIDDVAVGSFSFFMFARKDNNQQMNPPTLIGDSLPLTGDAIYLPYFMALMGGYELGDPVKLTFLETDLHFTFAGSTEESLFGAMVGILWRFYVSDEIFYELQEQFPDHNHTLLLARMDNLDDVTYLTAAYLEKIIDLDHTPDTQMILSFTFNHEMARANGILFPLMVGVVLTAFAIILLTVSLVVIRFRINNSIEEGMTNIGTLKAIGYRNSQIVTSMLLQFGVIALMGGVAGILISQAVLPLVISLLGPTFPLPWIPGVDLLMKLVVLVLVLVSVLCFSLISTKRIYKLYPLVALRGGLVTHSFKKNQMPLDKFSGPLALLLASKDLLQSKKQAFAIGLIITAISFATTSGLAVHYSISVEQNKFIGLLVGEIFDISVTITEADAGAAFVERTQARPEVRAITGFTSGMILAVDETIIFAQVVDDIEALAGGSIVDGRFPKHNNEVALANGAMRVLNKGIGDWVTVRSGGYEQEYLITGLIQGFENGGMFGMINGEGIARVQPGFAFDSFHIYLTEGVEASAFAEVIRTEEVDILNNLVIFNETMETVVDVTGGVFGAVTVVILIVTAIIIVVTMYLVIKTTILQRRRELGIQKALGFTTLQLMNQISLNLTPAILLGSVIGAMSAYFGFSSIFVALARGMGVVQVNISPPFGWTVILCIAMILLAYVVSMLVAWRIRKISTYALISE